MTDIDIVEKLLKSKQAGAKVAANEILMLRKTVAEAAIEAARSRAPSMQLGSGWPEILYPIKKGVIEERPVEALSQSPPTPEHTVP